MRRPLAHQIDEKAEQVLRRQVPLEWVIRRQTPDYGLDFTIEVFEHGEATGEMIAVQLKGTSSSQRRRPTELRIPISNSHLTYFAEHPLPVFLVVVDTKQEAGFYLFVQRRVLDDPRRKSRTKGTRTLHVPLSNALADTATLRTEIVAAIQYMRHLRPGSFEDAMRRERVRLQTLDPRLAVDIRSTQNGLHYHVSPREECKLTMSLRSPKDDVNAKLESLHNGGVVNFAPGEVTFAGSPLFEQELSTICSLQIRRELAATSTFRFWNIAGECLCVLESVPSTIRGGLTLRTLEASLPDSPFKVTLDLPTDRSSGIGQFHLSLQLDVWEGQPIRFLSYFEQLEPLLGRLSGVSRAEVNVFIRGHRASTASSTTVKFESVDWIEGYVRLLRKSVDLCKRLQISPRLPMEITPAQEREIEELHDLIFKGECRCGPMILSLTTSTSSADQLIDLSKSEPATPLKLVADAECEVFGEHAHIGTVTSMLEGITLTNRSEDSKSYDETQEPTVRVSFRAERVLRLLESERTNLGNSNATESKTGKSKRS